MDTNPPPDQDRLTLLEGWRPIESAPRDGTRILLWCVHANAKFSDDPVGEGWAAPVIGEWIDHNGGGWTWNGLCGQHTHWRPLPDGPASFPPPPDGRGSSVDESAASALTRLTDQQRPTTLERARLRALEAVQDLIDASDADLSMWEACNEEGIPKSAEQRHARFKAALSWLKTDADGTGAA